MNNFLKVGEGMNIIPLILAYKRQPQLWHEDTYLRSYPQGPFGSVESIILRFQERTTHETEEALKAHLAVTDLHECYDLPVYKTLPEARPLIFELMSFVQGERLGRVMINKVAPGGSITPHKDNPLYATYWDRFHICLETNDNVEFRCGDERAHIEPGEVYWFRNLEEHEVINHGKSDRVHMVIDIRTSKPPLDKRDSK